MSRHCERSEAIHGAASRKMDSFVAIAPRNDAKTPERDCSRPGASTMSDDYAAL
jgi:hypothetical protein